MCSRAVDLLNKDGEHTPLVIGFDKDGRSYGVLDLRPVMENRGSKNRGAAALNAVFLKTGVYAYVFIVEAWMRTAEKDENEASQVNPNVADHPDRFEILQVSMDSIDFQRSRIYSIMKGKVVGVWQEMDTRKGDKRTAGLFSNLTNPNWKDME